MKDPFLFFSKRQRISSQHKPACPVKVQQFAQLRPAPLADIHKNRLTIAAQAGHHIPLTNIFDIRQIDQKLLCVRTKPQEVKASSASCILPGTLIR